MRFLTYRTEAGTSAGRLDGDRVMSLPYSDVGEMLQQEQRVISSSEVIPLVGLQLVPVVPRPQKIFCLGLNYRGHVEEMGRQVPSHPTLFSKFAATLIGPYDDIVLPRFSSNVDWEAELAFVIGRRVRHVVGDEAEAAIAGYTVLNDVSVRDYQYRTAQWLQGKMFESTTPIGPALVTPDELDPALDLEVRCEVDGELRQAGRTSDLIFRPADIVAYISDIITLEPGDLIATGTPAGVGYGRDPQLFLRPGQTVRTSIEGVGELVNRCVAEPSD